MMSKAKRPISVWIAQILLGIYGFGTVLIVLWGFYKGLNEGIANLELYVVTTVGILTFAALFVGGMWGMTIRKPWGRWLGVAGLAILLIGSAINLASRWRSGESGLGYVLFIVLVVLGLSFLAYKVAAGDAADKFFVGKSKDVTEAPPAYSDAPE